MSAPARAAAAAAFATAPTAIPLSYRNIHYRTIFPEELDLGDQIGHGGYGAVYEAIWTPADGSCKPFKVAVKQMDIEAPHARKRFLKELAMLAKRNPRHCSVKLFGAYEKDDSAHIVMELIKDSDLRSFVRGEDTYGRQANPAFVSMVPHDKVKLMQSMARAVQSLHEDGIVHRDLTPGNFLVKQEDDGSWGVRICDYGLSDTMWTFTSSNLPTASTAVMDKKRRCTVPYTAPEWLCEDEDSIASRYTKEMDVYGLVTSFYTLLSKLEPFEGRSADDIRRLVAQGKRVSLQQVKANLPELWHVPMVRLLSEGWAHDPADRPSLGSILGWLGSLDQVQRIPAAVDEALQSPGSFDGAAESIDKLLEQDLPLDSHSVHRILAILVASDDDDFVKWGLQACCERRGQFTGTNPTAALIRFYNRYYHCITDDALDREFRDLWSIAEYAKKVPLLSGPRALPTYIQEHADAVNPLVPIAAASPVPPLTHSYYTSDSLLIYQLELTQRRGEAEEGEGPAAAVVAKMDTAPAAAATSRIAPAAAAASSSQPAKRKSELRLEERSPKQMK